MSTASTSNARTELFLGRTRCSSGTYSLICRSLTIRTPIVGHPTRKIVGLMGATGIAIILVIDGPEAVLEKGQG